ncbi:hypothetical protein BaRGS_00013772 [Batillaria attramentaria]|uniref:Uncharacterized protein n=1 Tax=Batillaria attramentaria TaxID=370345 RepID=A0ABD0L6E4_9CAEN
MYSLLRVCRTNPAFHSHLWVCWATCVDNKRKSGPNFPPSQRPSCGKKKHHARREQYSIYDLHTANRFCFSAGAPLAPNQCKRKLKGGGDGKKREREKREVLARMKNGPSGPHQTVQAGNRSLGKHLCTRPFWKESEGKRRLSSRV